MASNNATIAAVPASFEPVDRAPQVLPVSADPVMGHYALDDVPALCWQPGHVPHRLLNHSNRGDL